MISCFFPYLCMIILKVRNPRPQSIYIYRVYDACSTCVEIGPRLTVKPYNERSVLASTQVSCIGGNA